MRTSSRSTSRQLILHQTNPSFTSPSPLLRIATPRTSHDRSRRLQVHASAKVCSTRLRTLAFPAQRSLTHSQPSRLRWLKAASPSPHLSGFNHPHIVLPSPQPSPGRRPSLLLRVSAHCPSRSARHHWACDDQGTDCRLHVRRPTIKPSLPSLLPPSCSSLNLSPLSSLADSIRRRN